MENKWVSVMGGFTLRYGRLPLALLVIAALLLTFGCSSKTDPQKSAKKAMQQGGQLVYGSLQEPNTLNPVLSDLLATAEVGSLVFSGLTATNDKGEWIPDLAVDVPTLQNGGVSADGLTVTYHLRPNVTWHDGRPFTSADVQFTWQVMMNRKVNVVSREGYDKIASVSTPDASTVVIRFREFYAPFLTLFSTILPQHILASEPDLNKAAFNRAPIGTGPFKFKEWRIAEALVFEANPSYYRGKPVLDSIVYKVIPDNTIMLNQLKSGEADIVTGIAFNQLEQVKAISGVETKITPNMIWEHLDLNLENALFQDVRVRQALSLAIDRQALVNIPLKNVASPAAGDQSPLSWAYNPTLTAPARDVNGAKDLLTQAGWTPGPDGILQKDGRKFSFGLVTTGGNKTRESVAQAIAQQLREVGILVEPRYVDVPVLFGDVLKNRRFEAAMFAWVAGIDPDNVSLWNSKSIPGAGNGYEGQNYAGWRNPEVDALTLQAAHTANLESRKQMYYRIQDLLVQEMPVIPLYFRANIDAVKTTVLNYRPNPTPSGNLWNAWEWGFAAK